MSFPPQGQATPADIIAHAALATGVHGVGSLNIAGFHSAGEEVSKAIWKDTEGDALSDLNRTSTQDWTDLDLTSFTSAKAKFALLRLRTSIDSYTNGDVYIRTRKNGTSASIGATGFLAAYNGIKRADLVDNFVTVGLDSGQVVEYKVVVSGTAQVDFFITVLGYIE